MRILVLAVLVLAMGSHVVAAQPNDPFVNAPAPAPVSRPTPARVAPRPSRPPPPRENPFPVTAAELSRLGLLMERPGDKPDIKN